VIAALALRWASEPAPAGTATTAAASSGTDGGIAPAAGASASALDAGQALASLLGQPLGVLCSRQRSNNAEGDAKTGAPSDALFAKTPPRMMAARDCARGLAAVARSLEALFSTLACTALSSALVDEGGVTAFELQSSGCVEALLAFMREDASDPLGPIAGSGEDAGGTEDDPDAVSARLVYHGLARALQEKAPLCHASTRRAVAGLALVFRGDPVACRLAGALAAPMRTAGLFDGAVVAGRAEGGSVEGADAQVEAPLRPLHSSSPSPTRSSSSGLPPRSSPPQLPTTSVPDKRSTRLQEPAGVEAAQRAFSLACSSLVAAAVTPGGPQAQLSPARTPPRPLRRSSTSSLFGAGDAESPLSALVRQLHQIAAAAGKLRDLDVEPPVEALERGAMAAVRSGLIPSPEHLEHLHHQLMAHGGMGLPMGARGMGWERAVVAPLSFRLRVRAEAREDLAEAAKHLPRRVEVQGLATARDVEEFVDAKLRCLLAAAPLAAAADRSSSSSGTRSGELPRWLSATVGSVAVAGRRGEDEGEEEGEEEEEEEGEKAEETAATEEATTESSAGVKSGARRRRAD